MVRTATFLAAFLLASAATAALACHHGSSCGGCSGGNGNGGSAPAAAPATPPPPAPGTPQAARPGARRFSYEPGLEGAAMPQTASPAYRSYGSMRSNGPSYMLPKTDPRRFR